MKTEKNKRPAARKVRPPKPGSKGRPLPRKARAAVPEVEERPSLESILDKADKAFTDIVLRYATLADALIQAETYYGNVGLKAFRVRFPLTDNAIRNLELVGRGRLLPQFAMCSNKFVTGLTNMDDSLTWQYKLVGASRNGQLRVKSGGTITDIPFEDFRSGRATNAVLSLVSASDVNLTVDQLRLKLERLNCAARAKFTRHEIKPYEIRNEGGAKVVRFLKARTYTRDELQAILDLVSAE